MLNGKVVVVIGGAGLLGRRFSESIVKHGGIVVIADRAAEAAAACAEEINSRFGTNRATPAAVDITSDDSVDALIWLAEDRLGRIDAVINNAYPRNRNYGRKLEEVAYADFCENLGMHLGGYFLVAQRFCMYFRSRGGGNLVNIASIYGVIAPRFEIYADTEMSMPVEYAAIKSAIVHLTRYFAQYYKGDGVRANALSPGGILDRQPAEFLVRYDACCGTKGMLNPEDLEGALLFLLSDGSRYVNGQNLIVDDGFSL